MNAIELLKGDITAVATDAIVNAANTSLLGGGGVDGAIHKKGGKQILDECIAIRNKQGGCNVGEAVYTSAGLLPSKYVLHTVGPVWQNGHANENELLAHCYLNCLVIATNLKLTTLAFPNISTGIYKFPKAEAAAIAIKTVEQFLSTQNTTILQVTFVCFDDENYEIYKEKLK